MSKKERDRLAWMAKVQAKEMTVVDAAQAMGVSYREAKRIWKRRQAQGHAGLVHRDRGRAAPRRTPPERKRHIMAIVAERYADFGPTLAAEKLAQDHGEQVHPEFLRRWMVRSDRAFYRRPLQAGAELREIFSIQERRTVNRDWTVRFNNQWFQIEKQKAMPRAKAQVVVRRRLDGTVSLLYQDRPLAYHAIAAPRVPAQAPATKTGAKARRPSAPWRPAPDRPWRGRTVGKQLAQTEGGSASVSLSYSCPTGGSKTNGGLKERRNPAKESAPPVGPPPRRSGRSPALPYPPDGPKSRQHELNTCHYIEGTFSPVGKQGTFSWWLDTLRLSALTTRGTVPYSRHR